MLRSMTGFGGAEGDIGGRRLFIDVKAVNHRFFNFFSKLPQNIQQFESKIQSMVKGRLTRGQISVFATWDKRGPSQPVSLNMVAAREAAKVLENLKSELGLAGEVTLDQVLSFPAVMGAPDSGLDEAESWKRIEEIMDKALVKMEEFRVREGQDLHRDLSERLKVFQALSVRVDERAPLMVTQHKERLEKRLTELTLDAVDEALVTERVALEVATYAERSDVTEEIVRLSSHMEKFVEILEEEGPVGRKLDFLIQEMNRETNTIGSKTPDADTSRIVVEMKAELEKIREQIQNIE